MRRYIPVYWSQATNLRDALSRYEGMPSRSAILIPEGSGKTQPVGLGSEGSVRLIDDYISTGSGFPSPREGRVGWRVR